MNPCAQKTTVGRPTGATECRIDA